jgi:hypothetical protein
MRCFNTELVQTADRHNIHSYVQLSVCRMVIRNVVARQKRFDVSWLRLLWSTTSALDMLHLFRTCLYAQMSRCRTIVFFARTYLIGRVGRSSYQVGPTHKYKCGRKWFWPTLRCDNAYAWVEWWRTQETSIRIVHRCRGQESNWGPPEHMSEALPLEPTCSVVCRESWQYGPHRRGKVIWLCMSRNSHVFSEVVAPRPNQASQGEFILLWWKQGFW